MMNSNKQPKKYETRLMRMRQLCKYLALSRAYVYQKINEGTFPAGHMISPGIRVWEQSEVDAWLDTKMGNV